MPNVICPRCSSPAAMRARFCRSCGLSFSNFQIRDKPNLLLWFALIIAVIGMVGSVAFWLGTTRAQQPVGIESNRQGPPQTAVPTREQNRNNVPSSQLAKKQGGTSLLDTSKGSALRTELLDAIRPFAEQEFGGSVVFAVEEIRSDGEFAFVNFRPVRSNGTSISMLVAGGVGDAYGVALLSREVGGWKVDQFRTGTSDVWWCEFRESYPTLIFREDCSW